jgi:hypothetical protein
LDSMNRHHPVVGGTSAAVPIEWCNLLRLAALCHDVGHGLMSHVSENALIELPEVGRLKLDVQRALKRKCSLSEAAAYYLLGSTAFADCPAPILDATPTYRLRRQFSPDIVPARAFGGGVARAEGPCRAANCAGVR